MWISVHENVIGGKLRKLAKVIGCSQNEALGMLVRLWIWALGNADKDGKLIGADSDDIAEVLSVGISKGLDGNSVVEAMISEEWIDATESDLYIHDWGEWQMQLNKLKTLKEQNAQRQRNYRTRQKEKKIQEKAGTVTELNAQNASEDKPVKKLSGYTTEFETFWKAYPRKVGKGEAYKKYKARVNDGYSEEELLEAAKTYASICIRERTEDKYIKHPKTFLSDSTPFVDYIKKHPNNETTQPENSEDDDDPYKSWEV